MPVSNEDQKKEESKKVEQRSPEEIAKDEKAEERKKMAETLRGFGYSEEQVASFFPEEKKAIENIGQQTLETIAGGVEKDVVATEGEEDLLTKWERDSLPKDVVVCKAVRKILEGDESLFRKIIGDIAHIQQQVPDANKYLLFHILVGSNPDRKMLLDTPERHFQKFLTEEAQDRPDVLQQFESIFKEHGIVSKHEDWFESAPQEFIQLYSAWESALKGPLRSIYADIFKEAKAIEKAVKTEVGEDGADFVLLHKLSGSSPRPNMPFDTPNNTIAKGVVALCEKYKEKDPNLALVAQQLLGAQVEMLNILAKKQLGEVSGGPENQAA